MTGRSRLTFVLAGFVGSVSACSPVPGTDASTDANRIDSVDGTATDARSDVTPSSDTVDVIALDSPPGDTRPDRGPVDAALDVASDIARTDATDAVIVPDVPVVDAGPPDAAIETDTGPLPDSGPPDDTGPAAPVGDCVGVDEAVSSRPGDSRFASLVWTGTEYGVASQDDEDGNWEIYFSRMTPDGTVLSTDRITNDGAADEHPSLAWDGTRYAIAWSRTVSAAGGDTIRVALVTRGATSVTVGTANTITTGDIEIVAHPTLQVIPAASGGGFGVAWEDARNGADNHEIYYARLDATGSRTGSEIRVTDAPRASTEPILRWNSVAGEFGLLWLDDRLGSGMYPNEDLYFARVGITGARPSGGTDVQVTTDSNRSIWPSMTFDGTGYAVAWANERTISDHPGVFFTQLTAAGAHRAGAVERAISMNAPDIGAWTTSIAWSGSEYMVIWEDQRHANGDLFFQRVSAAGVPTGTEWFLHDDSDFSGWPSLVWGNGEWAASWEDTRYVHKDIWFRRIAATDCR